MVAGFSYLLWLLWLRLWRLLGKESLGKHTLQGCCDLLLYGLLNGWLGWSLRMCLDGWLDLLLLRGSGFHVIVHVQPLVVVPVSGSLVAAFGWYARPLALQVLDLQLELLDLTLQDLGSIALPVHVSRLRLDLAGKALVVPFERGDASSGLGLSLGLRLVVLLG
jgi:hypothetical protein